MKMLKDGVLYLPDETFAIPSGDNGVLIFKTYTGLPDHPRRTLELKLTDKDVSSLFRLLAVGNMDTQIRASNGSIFDIAELEPLPASFTGSGICVGMDLRDGAIIIDDPLAAGDKPLPLADEINVRVGAAIGTSVEGIVPIEDAAHGLASVSGSVHPFVSDAIEAAANGAVQPAAKPATKGKGKKK